MVFTVAQTTAFFEDADKMALAHDTFEALADEGITTVRDLQEFNKEMLKMVADNLRNPGGRIPNPDPNAPPGATIPRPPFPFGAKSRLRLIAASEILRYYVTIGRDPTPSNMRYDPVIKNFSEQWKALEERKDDDVDVPKITKGLKVMRWAEAFDDWLNQQIGVRHIPLKYVTRANATAPAVAPPLATDMPHSAEHGSVERELVMRATHNHPLFRTDNAKVYYALETATRGTQYAASLKPYQRSKNGRDALSSFISQFAGEDKWQTELKKMDNLLHTRVWKGNGNFTLEKHIAQHRNAFVSLTQCSEHVPFQLPNEHTRVTYLVDSIQNSDPGLQAALAQVRADKAEGGLSNSFEDTAAHLQPYDPVAKKRTAANKRDLADISDTQGEADANIGATSASKKPAIGKTGVEFRFYKSPEYNRLSDEQKKELHDYREAKKRKKGDTKSKPDKRQLEWLNKAVASSLKAKLEEAESEQKQESDLKTYFKTIVSEVVAEPNKKPGEKQCAKVAVAEGNKSLISLKSILRRAKS